MSKFIDKDYAKETIKLMLEVHQNFTWLEQEALKVALDALGEVCAVPNMMQMRIGAKELYRAVYDLPPVTPAEKVGHWEWKQYDIAFPEIGNYHCSVCDAVGKNGDNYCLVCGAKMREVKE